MGTRRNWHIAGWVMFAPYLLLLVIFGVVPIVLAFESSLAPHPFLNPDGGLDNYLIVFQDFRFMPALLNVALFLVIYLPVMLFVVILLSILLDVRPGRQNKYLMTLFIVPAAITGSVAILVWYFMLEPTLSPFRDLLHGLGITEAAQVWNTGNMAWIFAAMAFFTGAGYWILIMYGSLQAISEEVLEAAYLDGANHWQMATRVKLPLVKKYLIFMAVLTFAAGLQLFVEPQLISASVYEGIATGWTLNQVAYDYAFVSGNFSQAAAVSLVLLVASLAAGLLLIVRTNFFDQSEDAT
jgi:multiple sugar transport system permease protein